MFSLVSTLETIEEKPATKSYAGNKDESSTILDKYYSVQFSLSNSNCEIFQVTVYAFW